MAQTYRQQFLALIAQHERDMSALYRDLHERIMVHIYRAATGEDQTIPPHNSQQVRDAVSTDVLAFFVPGFHLAAGRVTPQSPYMRVLWPLLEQTVKVAVSEHGAIMARQLRRAPDVLSVLMMARQNPMVEARRVQEQTLPRRPFLEYDPLHRFVDPRGYRLSDRIWDTGTGTRRKIDQLLAEMIAEGKGSREIARELEPFLLPGRRIKRTNKPYGTNASYDGMRLGRTEITAAAGRAGRIAAEMNPFVDGADWVRSSSRRPCISGVCDMLAAGSPYTLDNLPDLPGSSHPHCMCRFAWHLVGEPSAIIAQLRDELHALRTPGNMSVLNFVTPVLVERFTRMLLDEPELQAEVLW